MSLLSHRSELSVAPASGTLPVAIDTVLNHLRIDTSDDNDVVHQMIEAAVEYAEESIMWKRLIDQTWIDYFDVFEDWMELRWSPVDSITSVQYLDINGSEQTLATTVYELAFKHSIGHVRLKYGQTFPSTYGHPDAVYVTYKAGYGTAPSDVPMKIRMGLTQLVAHWYRNREAVTDIQMLDVPRHCLMLLRSSGVGRMLTV